MDNQPMAVLRWALLACALIVCAWLVLGEVQTHAQDNATALVDEPSVPTPALTAQILHLLSTAGTLNPDGNIGLLRSQALTRAHRSRAGVRAAEQVARDEPMNADAWVVLGFAAQHVASDSALVRYANAQLLKLVPPVPAAP
jgi:hypothetical protein